MKKYKENIDFIIKPFEDITYELMMSCHTNKINLYSNINPKLTNVFLPNHTIDNLKQGNEELLKSVYIGISNYSVDYETFRTKVFERIKNINKGTTYYEKIRRENNKKRNRTSNIT